LLLLLVLLLLVLLLLLLLLVVECCRLQLHVQQTGLQQLLSGSGMLELECLALT
jgi:hypothetical protein